MCDGRLDIEDLLNAPKPYSLFTFNIFIGLNSSVQSSIDLHFENQ